jgi:hypothetical protein
MVSPMTQRRFHVTCSHMLLCVPTRKSARLTIKIACLVSSHTQQCDCSLTDTETYIGLGRMCNISVSALGPDSMLGQHIFDVNSWHSCLLNLCGFSFCQNLLIPREQVIAKNRIETPLVYVTNPEAGDSIVGTCDVSSPCTCNRPT